MREMRDIHMQVAGLLAGACLFFFLFLAAGVAAVALVMRLF